MSKIYRKPNKFKLNDIVIVTKANKCGRISGFQEDVIYDHYAKCDMGTYLYMVQMSNGAYEKYLENYLQLAPEEIQNVEVEQEPEIIKEATKTVSTKAKNKKEEINSDVKDCEIEKVSGFGDIIEPKQEEILKPSATIIKKKKKKKTLFKK
jgi:hypothetical protein